MKTRKYFWRLLFYVVGLLVMAFAVNFSINSDLGVSPISSLPYVVSLITKIDLGICVGTILSSYLFFQLLLLRK